MVLNTSAFTLVGDGPEGHFVNMPTAGFGLTVPGNVVGKGGFEFNTAGTLYLTGNNATTWVESFTAAQAQRGQAPYGGDIKINTGTIKFNDDTALGDPGNRICILIGGTLELAAGNGTLGCADRQQPAHRLPERGQQRQLPGRRRVGLPIQRDAV